MISNIRDVARCLDACPSSVIIQKTSMQRLLSLITKKIYEVIVQNDPIVIDRPYLISTMTDLRELLSKNTAPSKTFSQEQIDLAIKQVEQTKQLLSTETPYTLLWNIKDAQCSKGVFVLSKRLQQNLNDHAIEGLLKEMPEECRKEITTFTLADIDPLGLTEKSFEIVLKYLPNISEESLCEIGQSAPDMWNVFRNIPKEERQDVFQNAEKLFNRRVFGEEKVIIIEAIAKIAKEDRKLVVDCVVEISKELLSNALEIEHLLHLVATLPEEDRIKIVNNAITHFENGFYRDHPYDIISTHIPISKNNQYQKKTTQPPSTEFSPLVRASPLLSSSYSLPLEDAPTFPCLDTCTCILS